MNMDNPTTSQHNKGKSSALTSKVLKVMSMFTGLQMFGILCSVVKMKLAALWLGAGGVGLFGIYQSVIDTIATFTDLGIRQSAVRDVAVQEGNPGRLALLATTVRRWSLFAGLLGAVVIAAMAIPLGEWFFGNIKGCWGFLALSTAMFLNAVTGGEQALMQGAGKLRALARCNLIGSIAGLATSIPMFYLWGDIAVTGSIIAYAVAMCVASRWYRLKIKRPSSDIGAISLRQVWQEGKSFARLGICMAIAAFITSLAHTIFIGILNSISSTEAVGLVQAGDTIVVRYIGLIFTAIGMEFYPRAAANHQHNTRLQVFVNHEISLLLTVLTPLLSLFLMLRGTVVEILYSDEFTAIIPFISWAALSSIPKAVSWCMAYTIIAKGDGKIYILTEGLDALASVPICVFAYSYYGLTGLGIAYIIWYLLYALFVGTVYYRRYGMRLSRNTLGLTAAAFALCLIDIACLGTLPYLWAVMAICIVNTPMLIPLRRLLRR